MSGLGQLKNSERLIVLRLRNGETQRAAARRNKVTLAKYSLMERGLEPATFARHIPLGQLKNHERCLLYRRRAEITQAKVARDLKRSRYWVNLMETGKAPCDDLLWYWEQ